MGKGCLDFENYLHFLCLQSEHYDCSSSEIGSLDLVVSSSITRQLRFKAAFSMRLAISFVLIRSHVFCLIANPSSVWLPLQSVSTWASLFRDYKPQNMYSRGNNKTRNSDSQEGKLLRRFLWRTSSHSYFCISPSTKNCLSNVSSCDRERSKQEEDAREMISEKKNKKRRLDGERAKTFTRLASCEASSGI